MSVPSTITEARHSVYVTRLERKRRPLVERDDFTDREADDLRDAIMDLCSEALLSIDEIRAGVREHWGEASDKQIGQQLGVLVREGRLRREEGRYVRR